MPSKDFYREIAAYAEQKLTISISEWTSFLATASRLYKYPYHEQVMIHAQRPNATACAEYDVWNKKMGRFIRKGAKGIALLDDTQGKTKLRYVFDVSDTVVINEKSKTPWIWELEDKHVGPVMAMLERTYGVGGSEIESQIEGIARKLADEYWADHQDEILHIVDDSLLEEYDEFNIGVRFKTAATVSTAYSIMLRCGLEPEEYLQTIRDELPYMATTGMRFKTLTKDPEVRKAVDDIVYDFNGERNPHPLAYYQADGQKSPKKEGKAKER